MSTIGETKIERFQFTGSIHSRNWKQDKQKLREVLSRNDAVIINASGNIGIAYMTKLISFLHEEVEKVTLQPQMIMHEGNSKAVVTFTVYPNAYGPLHYDVEEGEF